MLQILNEGVSNLRTSPGWDVAFYKHPIWRVLNFG